MAHTRVLHVERGFHMSENYARQVMRDHCTITWVIEGRTIRDTTEEEKLAMRAQEAEKARKREIRQSILESNELPGIHFERPKTTKYRAPSREAYEEMEAPLAMRVCRWPRKKAA